MKKGIKILIGTVCTAAIIAGGVVGTYLYVIPTVVSSSWVNKTICKEVKKFLKDKGCIDKGQATKKIVDLIKEIISTSGNK